MAPGPVTRVTGRRHCHGPGGLLVSGSGGLRSEEAAMRVFIAGATGVIGRRVVPLLVADGHEVVGMTRSPAKADGLRAAGAEPVVADALDPGAVMEAVQRARPQVVVHELTDLS